MHYVKESIEKLHFISAPSNASRPIETINSTCTMLAKAYIPLTQ